MTTLSETGLSRSIQDALKSLGFMVLRIQSGKVKVRRAWMHLCEPGTPDLHLVGLNAWIEVKRPKQKPTQEQIAWHTKARLAGARVAIVTSVSEAVEAARRWKREAEACAVEWDPQGERTLHD